MSIGASLAIDYYGCDPARIDTVSHCHKAMDAACSAARLTVLDYVSHKFDPQGLTILLLLSESHLAIHTWPEKGLVCVDLFSCGDTAAPLGIVMPLQKAFMATSYKLERLGRGDIPCSAE